MNLFRFSVVSFFIFLIALSSCKTPQSTIEGIPAKPDKRLAGKWMGCEKGYQIEGVTRCWIMERKKDGTFSIYFEVDNKETPGNSTHYGKWWTKNGIFSNITTSLDALIHTPTNLPAKIRLNLLPQEIHPATTAPFTNFMTTNLPVNSALHPYCSMGVPLKKPSK